MKMVLPFLAVTGGLLTSALAQNLLINGDFETGVPTPWRGPGNVLPSGVGGSFVCFVPESNRIEQTVTTTPGVRYYLAADVSANGPGTATVSALPAAGGPADGAFTLTGPTAGSGVRKRVTFTASSSSSNIVLQVGTSVAASSIERGGSGVVFFDNVVLYELAPGTLAGSYRGWAITTLTVSKPAATNKTSRKVSARINRDGRIVVLDGTANIYAGQIFNDGVFDLGVGLTDTGAVRAQGKATLTANRIQLSLAGPSLPAADEGSIPIENNVTTEVFLSRVEP